MFIDKLLMLFLGAVIVFALVIDCAIVFQYLMQVKEFLSRNSLGLTDDDAQKDKRNN